MVTRYVHVLYQISRVSRFCLRTKSVATNCPPKMRADCRRGGAINRTCDYFSSYPHFLIVIIRLDGDGNKVCACAISNF